MSTNYVLPPVSQEFLEILDKSFPRPDVRPGYDTEAAMFSAGARHVIDWIREHSATKVLSGDIVTAQRAVVRMGS